MVLMLRRIFGPKTRNDKDDRDNYALRSLIIRIIYLTLLLCQERYDWCNIQNISRWGQKLQMHTKFWTLRKNLGANRIILKWILEKKVSWKDAVYDGLQWTLDFIISQKFLTRKATINSWRENPRKKIVFVITLRNVIVKNNKSIGTIDSKHNNGIIHDKRYTAIRINMNLTTQVRLTPH